MLTHLMVDGLKGVGRAELSFSSGCRVLTLFGQNGIGKTKCLEALFQFLLLGNRGFLNDHGNTGIESTFAVMRRAEDDSGHVFQASSERAMLLRSVWMNGEKGFHDSPIVFLGAMNRSSFATSKSGPALLGSVADRRNVYFDSLFKALRIGEMRTLGMDADIESWFVIRAHSVNPYQKDADNREVEISAVLEILNALDERFDPRFLQIDGSGRVSVKINGESRQLTQLSSGFTSLLKMVQGIVAGYGAFTNESRLRQVRGIVLIDEIESHLHARWQSIIVPRLKELFPNTTFFVATHSPLVLAQLEEGEAYLLQRDEEGSVRTHVIDSPSRRAFADVLEGAFGIDLNLLKRASMGRVDQSAAKKRLLALLTSKDPS